MVGVVQAAEKHWDQYKGNCSGFVHAVTSDLGIPISGLANSMVDTLSSSAVWVHLGHDGAQAQSYANRGYFVLGGLKAHGHGHVVVVVP